MNHRDPSDLGLLLRKQNETIQRLESIPTPTDWTEWRPNLLATVNSPNKGAGCIREGETCVDASGVCHGEGVMRFGSGMNRGSGTYWINLPYPAVVKDPRGYTIIGSGIVGVGLTHWAFSLHTFGAPGFRSPGRAVMAIQDGLFVNHAYPAPGDDIDNLHFLLNYHVASGS